MRRERVIVETLCDGCGEVIPTNGMRLEAGPLDFDIACAEMGACEGCGSLPSFPKQSVVVWDNCLGCWRAAMALPRGVCDHLLARWAPCVCRNLPGHSGGHECLCGVTWD